MIHWFGNEDFAQIIIKDMQGENLKCYTENELMELFGCVNEKYKSFYKKGKAECIDNFLIEHPAVTRSSLKQFLKIAKYEIIHPIIQNFLSVCKCYNLSNIIGYRCHYENGECKNILPQDENYNKITKTISDVCLDFKVKNIQTAYYKLSKIEQFNFYRKISETLKEKYQIEYLQKIYCFSIIDKTAPCCQVNKEDLVQFINEGIALKISKVDFSGRVKKTSIDLLIDSLIKLKKGGT